MHNMLQQWAGEGEFYIGSVVLLKFIELVTFVRYGVYICIA